MTSISPGVREMVNLMVATRRARGIKKAEVAKACNVPVSVLTNIERGEIDPTVSLLLEYAHTVGLNLRWTLKGKLWEEEWG